MSHIIRIAGNIVVFTCLAGILIVIAELIWYALPRRMSMSHESARSESGNDPAGPALLRIALITGATSGLGRAYACLVDRKMKDIDEIWLVGRRGERLRETADMLQKSSRCLKIDLTDKDQIVGLKALFQENNVQVGCLINCAGFGKIGPSGEMPLSMQSGMLDVNCTAPVAMINVCLPYMGAGSRIANICSTAGFQPLQYLNAYAASKAFLLRYTRALRRELLPRKIRVSAVCPYWIRDTEFIETAEKDGREGVKGFPISSNVRSVAVASFIGMRLGLPVVTPGIICTLHRIFSKMLPDTVLVYIWDVLRSL